MSGQRTDPGDRVAEASDDALGATLPLEPPIPSPPPAIAGGSRNAPATAPAATAAPGAQTPPFEVETELARGGIGRVLIAHDRRLDRPVAIKELIEVHEDALRRFEREARITARLQHPSIVGVHESGRWPDGRPFYAMELVAGRSLDEVVAGARTLADRLALVPRVLAVAEALAYAHRQRIIHRDLKPANVLCGEFGETVVIDWGLATAMDDARSAPGPGDVAGASTDQPVASFDGRITVAGTILGTPAYMPPEQAAGEAVDERADVYAIGAILYHVLAGRPPFSDAPAGEVLARVRIGPPAPIASLVRGCPRDLRDVVDKAMARDPAARYRTARELADDLLRFQTGQLVAAHRYNAGERLRRFIGRHRAAVAVAVVLLAVLAATSIYGVRRIIAERDQARRHREAAERRRAAAEDLIEFMVGDLRERLEPIGRVDALAGVGGAVEDYYAGLARDDALGDRELSRRAAALILLGDARKKAGDVPGARTAYSEALDIRRRGQPGDDAGIASAITKLGVVEEQAGSTGKALAAFRQALDMRSRLAAADPQPHRRVELVESHNQVGDLLESRGDLAGALAEHRRARDLAATLSSELPDDGQVARLLFNAHLYLADSLRAHGDTAAAIAGYRDGVALAERWTARAPDDARWHRNLQHALGRLGTGLQQIGDRAGSEDALQRTLAVAEKMSRDDPSNRELEAGVATAALRLGDLRYGAGTWQGALDLYRRAGAILDGLSRMDPSNLIWQRDRILAHGRIGRTLHKLKDLDGALAEQKLALAASLALAGRDPGNAGWQSDLSVRHDNLGLVLLARGDIDGALAAYGESLRISERLVASDPANAEFRQGVVIAHQNLAEVMLSHHRPRDQALDHCRRAQARLDELAGPAPSSENAAWQAELRALCTRLGR